MVIGDRTEVLTSISVSSSGQGQRCRLAVVQLSSVLVPLEAVKFKFSLSLFIPILCN